MYYILHVVSSDLIQSKGKQVWRFALSGFPYAGHALYSTDGLVGYDDALTQRRSRVQFSVGVTIEEPFCPTVPERGQSTVLLGGRMFNHLP